MEKTIYSAEEAVGRAEIEEKDGDLQIKASCTYKDGIWRLYMTGRDNFVRLGVLFPDAGRLFLQKRISLHALGLSPEDAEFVILPGDETPKLPKKAETPEKEAENRPETPPDAPAGEMDRWLSCTDTAALTSDEVLMPLLSRLDGVLYRYRSGGIELAVPAEAAEAISAVLCLTRDERIRDRDYFVVSLNRSGSPAPAMQSSTY